MSTERDEMPDIEVFLSAARQDAPGLGAPLRERILADAAGVAHIRRTGTQARARRFPGWFSGWVLSGTTGGALVTLAGFWVGLVAPLPLDAPLWMLDGLSHLETVTLPLFGVMDPLVMGF